LFFWAGFQWFHNSRPHRKVKGMIIDQLEPNGDVAGIISSNLGDGRSGDERLNHSVVQCQLVSDGPTTG
jgi:hypothetical protein